MSRKKTSTPTASLASCLDFAARILSTTATVQEICTKTVLAPLVVEAHRCGQQVAKSLDVDTPADVRKLMKLLQSEERNKLCQLSPLADLEVADLTWDFEGAVVDTLTMEIEELEDRAVMGDTDTCIVLSASSQAAVGQAVIWFPLDSNDLLPDSKRRQILLYVCPGRVKVVKSVGDLIKKMYDELPVLRENGATYKVWAVIMGSKSYNQQEDERTSSQLGATRGENNQHTADSDLKPSNTLTDTTTVRSSVNDTNQIHPITRSTESRRSRDSNNRELVDNQSGSVGEENEVTRDDEPDQDRLLSVSPRFSGYRDVTNTRKYSTKSIFSFGGSLKSSTEQPRPTEHVVDNYDVTEVNTREEVAVNSEAVILEAKAIHATSSGDEMGVHDAVAGDEANLHENHKRLNERSVLSSSLANLTTTATAESIEADSGLGLGVRLQQGFAWQSCDGKVLRKTIRVQRPAYPNDEPSGNKHLDSRGSRGDDEDEKEEFMEAESEVNASRERIPDEAHDGGHDDNNAEVKQAANEALRSDEVQFENHEQLHLQTLIKIAKTEDDNQDPPSPLGYEPGVTQAGDNTRVSIDVPRSVGKTKIISSAFEEVLNKDENDSTKNDGGAVGRSNDPDSHDEAQLSDVFIEREKVSSEHKRKLAVNYREKLGARIWWELEYTAKRLEREEMMERRQQARQRQRDSRQRERVSTSRHSQPVHPTASPANHLSVNRMLEVDASKNRGNTDQLSSDQQNITKVAHNDEEHAPLNMTNGKAEAISSHGGQSTRSFENEIPPCKTVSPSRNPQSLKSSEPIQGFEREERSSFPSKGERNDTTSASNAPELHIRDDLVVMGMPCISPAGTSSERDSEQLREEPSSASFSKFVERESVKPSFGRATLKPVDMKSSNQPEDADETLIQKMWRSTRTNYECDRYTGIFASTEEDALQTSEVASVPFTIRGRVPMRSRFTPVTDEPSSSNSNEHSPSSVGSHHEVDDTKLPTRRRPPRRHASTNLAVTTPAPVATFIALGEENTVSISAKSREDRLKDLRQKKLQKLQQARDSSLQQKEKQQRQVHRPLSFSNFNYTNKASNRQLIQNALEFTLLAGGSMEKERMLALQALTDSTCDNFIVLLKSAKELKFRALYENHVDRDFATRIFSLLPSNSSRAPLKLESSDMISQFFKYSSAKKQFLPVPTRSFTVKTDACALADQFVFKGKTGSALARLL